MSTRPAQPDETTEEPLDDVVDDDPFLEEEEPDLEEELEDDLDEELEEDEDTDDDDADLDQQLAAEDAGEEDEEHTGVAVVPPDAEFDDDAPVAPVEDDEDDDEIEGLRDGEFICRGCFMAKRETQLADPDRLLCRDCA